jgi:ubiquinone/menaquinone biosynthesis C-methylase UbiE
MKNPDIKRIVKENYGKIAKVNGSSCCTPKKSYCGSSCSADHISKNVGYSSEELKSVPDGANLGLGCGNPVALASLKKDDIVLDLGSGAGFDCFLAAKKVGKKGKVIGVDMTPEMIEKAKSNAAKGNIRNVEFRLGEIENIPVNNNAVDVVISNCVINLSPDKKKVFKEAFRVLNPGGRLIVSDIVILKKLPNIIKNSIEAYVGCLAGAIHKDEYIAAVKNAGFKDIKIVSENSFPVEFMSKDPVAKAVMDNLGIPLNELQEIGKAVISIKVSAVKPN